jgi:hypothetical protein
VGAGAGIVSAVLLALVITASTVPGLGRRVFGPAPSVAPTAARTPDDDLIYLLPNPPGVDVSLDRRTLARLPFPGGSASAAAGAGPPRLRVAPASATVPAAALPGLGAADAGRHLPGREPRLHAAGPRQ